MVELWFLFTARKPGGGANALANIIKLSVEAIPPGALLYALVGGASIQNVSVLVVAAGAVVDLVGFRRLEEIPRAREIRSRCSAGWIYSLRSRLGSLLPCA